MKKKRRLFCEISPLTYRIAVWRKQWQRNIQDAFRHVTFASQRQLEPLPYRINAHQSLIRRKLGNADPLLQDNKAVNLALCVPHINGILIRPGETFSFWRLVGPTTAKRGYREGLTVSSQGRTGKGIGGGLCQFTNLLHWMFLHSDLEIIERHHHEDVDIFPDYGRQVPFGTGTSIVYNYLDYCVVNHTERTYQLLIEVDNRYLKGELRADAAQLHKAHIHGVDEFFSREGGIVYRNGKVQRTWIDSATGEIEKQEILQINHVRVMYDTTGLEIRELE
ncbi:MAG: VanW family protein [Eubacteriales bacterium]|nr:VanW family protein [Eubacteriales bacterium]